LEHRDLLSFLAPMNFDTGGAPRSVAAGDFNGDGIPDLVTVSGGFGTPGSVSVLLGNGDGSFRPPVNYPIGMNPTNVVVADFDGDHTLDIAVASGPTGAPGSVSILLGNGNGTFRAGGSFPVGVNPTSLVAADFNGDGILDLATTNRPDFFSPASVSVLLGNGNGTFRPAINSPTGPAPGFLVAGDLNRDGHVDLVTLDQPTSPISLVSVLLGNGDGSFRPPVDIQLSSVADSLALADLNGDGSLDLVTAGRSFADSAGFVSVLLGNGDGSFQPPTSYPAGPSASFVTVVDVNGDTIPDLIVANGNPGFGGSVSVLQGVGDGSFLAPVTYPTGPGPFALTVADVNGDTHPDIVTANANGNNVSVLLGVGDGSFASALSFPAGSSPRTLLAADLNGDSIADLVTSNCGQAAPTPARVNVLLGNGDGSYRAPVSYAVGDGCRAVAVGDVNGDGIPDIVTVNAPSFSSGSVSVLLGNGDGTFRTAVNFALPSSPFAMALADLNGDGILDLVITNNPFSGPGSVSVLLGNGNGTFGPPANFAVGSNPRSVAVADLNGDGIPDLVTANNGDNTVSVLLGNGNGTFQPALNFPTGIAPVFVTVADLNGDGKPDLITANSPSPSIGPGTVSVLLGNGNGTFQAPATVAAGFNPSFVVVGDFNNDEIPDLTVTGAGGTRVLLGNGDGTFQATSVSFGSAGSALVATDVNGDGLLDLLVALPDYDRIAVLINDGNWPTGGGPGGSGSGDGQQPDDVGAVLPGLWTFPPRDALFSTVDPASRPTREETAALSPDRVERLFRGTLAVDVPLGLSKKQSRAWVEANDGEIDLVQASPLP
jgi:hypothetical protein